VADHFRGEWFAEGVSFRKPGCGFEGIWKCGQIGFSYVPEFSRFTQASTNSLWICGIAGWKGGFAAGLARVCEWLVLQCEGCIHSLHRGLEDGGNFGWELVWRKKFGWVIFLAVFLGAKVACQVRLAG